MIRGEEDSDSIPTDLAVEILSRLPATSIARFRCVSKQWESMLISPYFIELFRTRSSAWPHLLFAVRRDDGDDWYFFTSPQPQDTYEKSSPLVVTADSHMKFTGDANKPLYFCGHASGLIYLCGNQWTDKGEVICNPITGQYVSLDLPEGRFDYNWRRFLGFDPIEKQFKVLLISYPDRDNYCEEEEREKEQDIQILTLGAGNDPWRKIHFPLTHFPDNEEGICIKGVLYYLASRKRYGLPSLVVFFDVRSEKFKFIDRDFLRDSTLINYKGKLGVITREYLYHDRRCVGLPRNLKLCMWVLKDVEKPEPEWSEYVYTSRINHLIDHDRHCHISITEAVVSGVTASGEIVLSMDNPYISEPFYVFFLNLEMNTLKSVEIKGFGGNHFDYHGQAKYRTVKIFVEDLNFINMKTAFGDATTSITPPEEEKRTPPISTSASAKALVEQVGRKFKSINIFDSLSLLDDE